MEKSYEATYHNLEEEHWWFCGRRDMIMRLVSSAPKDSRILEVGCSGGSLLTQLKDAGYENIFGIDVSAKAVRLSREKGLENITEADGKQTGFSENYFDIIIVSDVLEHIKEDLQATKEWRRILKPNGFLIAFVPAHMFLWSAHDTVNHHIKRYSRKDFLARIREGGFFIKKSGYWNFFLFLPILLLRGIRRVAHSHESEAQLYRVNRFSNKALFGLLYLENYAIAHGVRFPLGVSLFCVAYKRDYRTSHQTDQKSIQYDERIYRYGSYDDIVWESEKKVLLTELRMLQADAGTIKYLDFACGTGRIIALIEPLVSRAIGVDVSQPMLNIARKKIKHSELIEVDLTARDVLHGQKFDLVTAFRFFLNAEDPLREAAMALLAQKLKDEKSIFIFNFHGNVFSYRLITKLWYWFSKGHLNTATYWQAKQLIERNGLVIVRWHGLGYIPKFFYRYINNSFLGYLDAFLARVSFIKYIAFDLIFVCKKV